MRDLKIPVALDADENEVEPADAEPGKPYLCPDENCREFVYVRAAQERQSRGRPVMIRSFFRHNTRPSGCSTGESLAHRLAKDSIQKQVEARIAGTEARIPTLFVPCYAGCGRGYKLEVPTPVRLYGDRSFPVRGTKTGKERLPDTTLEFEDDVHLLLEFREGHAVPLDKRADLADHLWVQLDARKVTEDPFEWHAETGTKILCDECLRNPPDLTLIDEGSGKRKPVHDDKEKKPRAPSSREPELDERWDARHRWEAVSMGDVALLSADTVESRQKRRAPDSTPAPSEPDPVGSDPSFEEARQALETVDLPPGYSMRVEPTTLLPGRQVPSFCVYVGDEKHPGHVGGSVTIAAAWARHDASRQTRIPSAGEAFHEAIRQGHWDDAMRHGDELVKELATKTKAHGYFRVGTQQLGNVPEAVRAAIGRVHTAMDEARARR